MTIRKLILGSFVAAALGSAVMPAAARTNVDLYVNFAPPPAYYEPVPVARVGWVWVPGYWGWQNHAYHWVPGHYVRARPGYVYHAPSWYSHGGRYYYAHGGWRSHDVDRDGVPNRYDRFPHNPYRR